MSVVVHLFTVEAALHLQTAQSLMQLLDLRPPTLTVQTLLTDVLEGAKQQGQNHDEELGT